MTTKNARTERDIQPNTAAQMHVFADMFTAIVDGYREMFTRFSAEMSKAMKTQ